MTKKTKEVKVETESGKIITSQDQLKSFLKNNKDSHYNFEESIEYKISSGSLLLDYFLNGGIGTGLHRFCGINEGGKTSCALQFMKNFLDQPKKRKGFYIKAEGRLSKEMIARLELNSYLMMKSGWKAHVLYLNLIFMKRYLMQCEN